ncbi:MAG: hypothetical protein U5R48_10450 [Gammaproteobacteria bacterium]|nr:hypothetical protein [Gammaproteobacteria bacterium]
MTDPQTAGAPAALTEGLDLRDLARRRLIDRTMRWVLGATALLSVLITTAIVVILVRESWASSPRCR